MDLTERIQYLCESNGISLNALEKQLDFGTRTISKWKASSPKVENLIKIADYFNVSIDYLVGRSLDPKIKEEPQTEVKGSVSYADIFRKYGVSEESVPILDEIDIAKIKAYIQGLIDSKRNK